jgi:hypothetical protein
LNNQNKLKILKRSKKGDRKRETEKGRPKKGDRRMETEKGRPETGKIKISD